eukprot:1144431-Amphidinium_carterae.1
MVAMCTGFCHDEWLIDAPATIRARIAILHTIGQLARASSHDKSTQSHGSRSFSAIRLNL